MADRLVQVGDAGRADLFDQLIRCQSLPFGLPGCVGCITEPAPQITTAGPDEETGDAGQGSLALSTREGFGNAQRGGGRDRGHFFGCEPRFTRWLAFLDLLAGYNNITTTDQKTKPLSACD